MTKADSLIEGTRQQLLSYKQVLNVMPAGVILLDETGLIVEANPEASRLLGEPLVNEKWLAVINRAFSPRADDGHEVSLRDGKKVKLAISPSSLGQLILVTDMTQTRLLQARVSSLQRLSLLGRMISAIAHQVRTPLSAALLYAANLLSTKLTDEKKRTFQKKLVNRLNDIEKQVNDMLFFAKGEQHEVASHFGLAQLFSELMPMVEVMVAEKQVDFNIVNSVNDVTLFGNINALASALSNLVINAIQLSEQQCKVRIMTKLEHNQLSIAVSDNGPGIKPEHQAQIFTPFFTTREQGTGLGLSVVQMICHNHQGCLHFESTLGQGSVFTLCLPVARPKVSQPTKEAHNASN